MPEILLFSSSVNLVYLPFIVSINNTIIILETRSFVIEYNFIVDSEVLLLEYTAK